jgi:hypothetical protein
MFRKQSIALALAYMTRSASAFAPSTSSTTMARSTTTKASVATTAAATFHKMLVRSRTLSSSTTPSSFANVNTMLKADVDEAAEPTAVEPTAADETEQSAGDVEQSQEEQQQADDLSRVVYVVNLSYGK